MESLDEWIAGGGWVELAGHRIFFRQDGPVDGMPLTLLHGYPTSSHDWSAIVPDLIAAGCRVTTLDLLGFGAGDKPRGYDYRIAEQAALVEALWSHLGITRTALVAHDYGVTVAQELLDRDRTRITHMAWTNGGLYADLHRPLVVQRLLHSPLGSILGPAMTEASFRMSLRKVLARPVADEVLHDMWSAVVAGGGRHVQRRLLRYIDERREHAARWQRAHETYPGPTVFIWGPDDPVSGGHVLARLRERLPDAGFVVLDEEPVTGHYPHVENPAAVAAALTTFLAGRSS